MAKDETPADRFYSQAQLDELLAKTKQEAEARIAATDERFKTLDDEVKNLRKVQKEAEKAEKARQEAIEAERKKAEEAQMSAKELIAKRDAEFNAKLAEIEARNAEQLALVQKEAEFQKLAAHVQRRITEEGDGIAPEFHDYIGGNTIEEIEASIERAKAKTEQIWQGIQQAQVAARSRMPGVAPAAGTNGVGPMDAPGDRQYSEKDIQAMGMAEYAEFRKRVGMGGANNQGLFR